MQFGIVESFYTHHGSVMGSFVMTASGEHVAFSEHEGRSFLQGYMQPLFHTSAPPPDGLKKGDLVVFELAESPDGLRAKPWGLYANFREYYERKYRPCLPGQAYAEFPFLIDVLIAGRRLFTPGRFRVAKEPLSKDVLKVRACDDLVAFKLEHYYVVSRTESGSWSATELKSELVCRDGRIRRRQPAPAIGEQLRARHLLLRRGVCHLVRLSVDDRVGLITNRRKKIPPHIAVQQRSLTVYL